MHFGYEFYALVIFVFMLHVVIRFVVVAVRFLPFAIFVHSFRYPLKMRRYLERKESHRIQDASALPLDLYLCVSDTFYVHVYVSFTYIGQVLHLYRINP